MCFLCSHKSNNDARMDTTKPILTITGSDSTGGSGIQADISTIAELGGNVVTAITCITVQTSLGIQEFFDIPAEIVSGQIDAVMNDFQPQIVKIGMIRREEVLTAIVEALERYRPRYVIYAPVIQSSRGEALMTDKAISKIRQQLLPLCTQVVVRRQDAELLQAACDICLLNDATMHGIANSFSSALAVYLSEGETVEQAKAKAKAYVKAKTARASNLQGRASELYNEFLDGATPAEIADALTRSGITSPMRLDRWREGTIRGILSNEKYCGDVLYQKYYTPSYIDHKSKKNTGVLRQYLWEHDHPAIIEKKRWLEAQELLKSRKGRFGAHSVRSFAKRVIFSRIKSGRLAGYYLIDPEWDREARERFLAMMEEIQKNSLLEGQLQKKE